MPSEISKNAPWRSYAHSIRQEIVGVLVFVGIIWGVFLVTRFMPEDWRDRLSLIPRYLTRLHGILAMPFLHKDVAHLASNTFPLLVLLTLLAGSRVRSSSVVVAVVLLSGALLWMVGRNGTPLAPIAHIGASGLVFGLITFLVTSGFLEKRVVSILIAILVGLMYGGALLWEIFLPFLSTNDRVSWEGHVCGAIAGVIVAFLWIEQPWQRVPRWAQKSRRQVNR